MAFRILIAEDEEITLKHLVNTLQREGYDASGVPNGMDALQKIEKEYFDLLITDIKMPGMTGMELLPVVKSKYPETEVIVITGFGSIGSAVEAVKKGAVDYITKPFDLDELIIKVKKIFDQRELKKENTVLKAFIEMDRHMKVVSKSENINRILESIEGLRDSDCNVLLTGESGVGKSLFAKMIHYTGRRQQKPFLSLNCATLTENLLSSELFGYEKGAFTGAVKTKPGLVEIADTGTLFLDEITEMTTSLQAKLLRVIEDGEFFRVGGTKPLKVDVRFIAATNRNIKEHITEGRFREDLYYRLNVMEIFIPPLRDHREDIEPLSLFFLEKHLPKYNRKVKGFSQEAMEILKNYSFPGNVRELENIVERAIILEKSQLITPSSLPQSLTMFQIETIGADNVLTIEEMNKRYAEKVIDIAGGNRSKAAELLGISRTSLWRILKGE
ncbi:MAG TPA: sigma-54 dependent transcriptional regulator [Dissulfurispiraceae bacterium]|nr:sigma-54 dependent transcriptional regulator [Dissulfurispiraceae bacterium]